MAAMDMEIVYLESVNAIPAMTANIAVKVSFEFLPGKQIWTHLEISNIKEIACAFQNRIFRSISI